MSTCTCHTSECQNNGVGIEMNLTHEMEMEDGSVQTIHITNVICGPCGQPITDVTDDAPSPEPATEGMSDD